MDDFSFGIEKLQLQGAVCSHNELKISSAIVTDLHVARLRWLVKSGAQVHTKARSIYLPVYLNATRSDVLFTANFALAEGQLETVFFEKGVALIASATLS